ncbi:threonine synthase, partial [Francisella tularensis subsp. holarctica]|nr:threonine synthase [Francisella tularensis subsp. holarctica]
GNYEYLKANVYAICVSDFEIIEEIKQVYRHYHEVVCPHTATGFVAKNQLDSNKVYIIVATAHPAQIESVIEPLLDIQVPPTPELQ